MATIATRVGGALLALLGLVLGVVGFWFATALGSSGTATFTASPDTDGPVVIDQHVLNRTDGPVVVRARAQTGEAFVGVASPTDAAAVVDRAAVTRVTGVSVTDRAITTERTGTGPASRLAAADLWREQHAGTGPQTVTIEQRNAPEVVVAMATQGRLAEVTLTWTDRSWFVKAVVASLVGLFLVLAGVLLLVRGVHRAGSASTDPRSADAPTDMTTTASQAESRPADDEPADAQVTGTTAVDETTDTPVTGTTAVDETTDARPAGTPQDAQATDASTTETTR